MRKYVLEVIHFRGLLDLKVYEWLDKPYVSGDLNEYAATSQTVVIPDFYFQVLQNIYQRNHRTRPNTIFFRGHYYTSESNAQSDLPIDPQLQLNFKNRITK